MEFAKGVSGCRAWLSKWEREKLDWDRHMMENPNPESARVLLDLWKRR